MLRRALWVAARLVFITARWLLLVAVVISFGPSGWSAWNHASSAGRYDTVLAVVVFWLNIRFFLVPLMRMDPSLSPTADSMEGGLPQGPLPLLERARHEAAHAIVAHQLGRLEWADVAVVGDVGGTTRCIPADRPKDLWDHATICAASVAISAEGCGGDRETMHQCFDILAGEPGEQRSHQQMTTQAIDRATLLLVDHLDALEAIARQLVLTGRVTDDDVAKILTP